VSSCDRQHKLDWNGRPLLREATSSKSPNSKRSKQE
jgi:hypothetical protein